MCRHARFSKGRMPTRPIRRATATSPGGCILGAKEKDAVPAGKMEWILKFNDVMMALLLNSDKGVRPSDRDVYRRLKRQFERATPSRRVLDGWRKQARRLNGGS